MLYLHIISLCTVNVQIQVAYNTMSDNTMERTSCFEFHRRCNINNKEISKTK